MPKTAKGGDVTVRARIGRFYKDADLTFVVCENQIVTILAANNLPTAVIYAHEKAETDTAEDSGNLSGFLSGRPVNGFGKCVARCIIPESVLARHDRLLFGTG